MIYSQRESIRRSRQGFRKGVQEPTQKQGRDGARVLPLNFPSLLHTAILHVSVQTLKEYSHTLVLEFIEFIFCLFRCGIVDDRR